MFADYLMTFLSTSFFNSLFRFFFFSFCFHLLVFIMFSQECNASNNTWHKCNNFRNLWLSFDCAFKWNDILYYYCYQTIQKWTCTISMEIACVTEIEKKMSQYDNCMVWYWNVLHAIISINISFHLKHIRYHDLWLGKNMRETDVTFYFNE